MATFEFDHVSVVADDGTLVLDDVSTSFGGIAITAIVGASGSGKSTLLRCCNLLEIPTAGVVRYAGTALADVAPRPHRRQVAMVFQRPVTFPGSVLDNLRAADHELTRGDAGALLDRVGLPGDKLDQDADRLSGGEAQRMTIARALATSPTVLLADECTSSLDHDAKHRIEELVGDLAADGLEVIWVTHELAQAERLAGRTLTMANGNVTAETV